MKSRKNLIIIALVVLVSVVGLSYAFFNYYQVSQRNLQLITGEIYLRLDDGTDEVMLLNAFPETREEARSRNDNYITFTITGKNTTTNHDIHYEIDLNEGDPVEGRTRLKASDLRFDLVEIRGEDEVYVVWDESFENFDEKRIWVDHVYKNTDEDIERVYKLRMWISDDVLISDTDPNASYTTGEYKNSYASVKVSVFGDFNEKATDAACFTTETYGIGNFKYPYTSYEINTTDVGIATCKTIMTESLYNSDMSDAKDGYQSFCEGTGTFLNGYTMNTVVSTNIVSIRDKLIAANYITDYIEEERYYSLNTSSKSRNTCENYISNNYPDISLETCYDKEEFRINFPKFTTNDIDYFEENGVLNRDTTEIPGVSIIDYDASCGSEVFIPTTINGAIVTAIGSALNDDGSPKNVNAFQNKNLEKVVIPNNINVGVLSFRNNNLKSIVIPQGAGVNTERIMNNTYSNNKLEYVYIPNGIKIIENSAFKNNELSEIILPEGLNVINGSAFAHNKIESLDIPSSVIRIEASAFNDNLLSDNEGFIYARTDADSDGVGEIDYTKIVSYGGANKDVVIPSDVREIGLEAFSACGIESVNIPEGVTTIGARAFYENEITNINIPNSVTTIGSLSFVIGSKLKTITIGNGIMYIGATAFSKSPSLVLNNSNLVSITIDKTCAEIKTIQATSTNTTIYYPWLSDTIPYTAIGVTVYGANGEVCDTY